MEESRIPRETREALRRFAEFRIAPETMDAIRSATTMSEETREMIRRSMTIAPETMEALRRATTMSEETRETIRRSMAIAPETTAAIRRLMADVQFPVLDESIREAMQEAFRRFHELWEHSMPTNWKAFEPHEVTATIERVRVTGVVLVWIPRAEIVREILATEDGDTAAVLLARRDDVLDDALACLSEVEQPDLVMIREGVEEAVGALRAGFPLAAQALASVAFTSEIHEFFEMGTKASRKRMVASDPEDGPLGQLRLRTIFVAAAKALDEFRPDRAHPVRYDFNRHNSAHRLTREQWTEVNALSAIMLSTALLREIQYWYARGDAKP